MKLILVRHAEPQRHVAAGEPADPPLTENGVMQAAALAEWLVDESVDAVYSSPQRRARETSVVVAGRLGLEMQIEEGIAEFDRHMNTYIPVEELKAASDGQRWSDMVEDRWEFDGPTFQQGVVAAMDGIIASHAGQTAVAVCHGGVINAYLSWVLGCRDLLFFEPVYTSVSRVLAARTGERHVESLNEHCHLRPPPASGTPARHIAVQSSARRAMSTKGKQT